MKKCLSVSLFFSLPVFSQIHFVEKEARLYEGKKLIVSLKEHHGQIYGFKGFVTTMKNEY